MRITNRVDDAHRLLIKSLPCATCGRPKPSVRAHVRLSEFGDVVVPYEQRGATSIKPADRWLVPLCAKCHGIQHSSNPSRNQGERHFWEQRGINPLELAAALWRNRYNRDACLGIVQRASMGATL